MCFSKFHSYNGASELLREVVDKEHIRRVYIQEPIVSAAELSELRVQLAEARSSKDELQGRLDNALNTSNQWEHRAKERAERLQPVEHEANRMRQDLQAALSARDSLCARVEALENDADRASNTIDRLRAERNSLRERAQDLAEDVYSAAVEKARLESGLARVVDAMNRMRSAQRAPYNDSESSEPTERDESDDGMDGMSIAPGTHSSEEEAPSLRRSDRQ